MSSGFWWLSGDTPSNTSRVPTNRSSVPFSRSTGPHGDEFDAFGQPEIARVLLVVRVVPVLMNSEACQPLSVGSVVRVIERAGRRVVRQRGLMQVVVHAALAREIRPFGLQEIEGYGIDGHRVLRRKQTARPVAGERAAFACAEEPGPGGAIPRTVRRSDSAPSFRPDVRVPSGRPAVGKCRPAWQSRPGACRSTLPGPASGPASR